MGNCIKLFPSDRETEESYAELDENHKTKTDDVKKECIICFYDLDEKDISSPCNINNFTLNAHKNCIDNWFEMKGCCPICNEEWIKPPKKPFSRLNICIEPPFPLE